MEKKANKIEEAIAPFTTASDYIIGALDSAYDTLIIKSLNGVADIVSGLLIFVNQLKKRNISNVRNTLKNNKHTKQKKQ